MIEQVGNVFNETSKEMLEKLGFIEIIKYNKIKEKNKQLQERIDKAIEILHNINEDLPINLILEEIEHSEYILKGEE